jgi:hypothetical protein
MFPKQVERRLNGGLTNSRTVPDETQSAHLAHHLTS